MPDYELKQRVISNGCVAQTNKLHKADYLAWVYSTTGDRSALERSCKVLDHIDYKAYDPSEVKEAERVIHSHVQRTKRLKDKISVYLDPSVRLFFGQAVFLTLTFNNETLRSTSKETRRRYVARYLKSYSCNYVANIDYGKKHEREHYHALILSDKINYKDWHPYGAIKGEKVRLNDDSPVRLSKYISKLTNHAIKETAKGCRMLYSRNGIKVFKDGSWRFKQ